MIFFFFFNFFPTLEPLSDLNVTQTAGTGCEVPQGQVRFLTQVLSEMSLIPASITLNVAHIFTEVVLTGRGRAGPEGRRRQQCASHPQHHWYE